jgi:hypothetical protein
MTWIDTEAITIMKCDMCGKEQEWCNTHRSFENPTAEDIEVAKAIDGWCNVGVHKYNGTTEEPTQVEVEAIMYHLCPDCFKKLPFATTPSNMGTSDSSADSTKPSVASDSPQTVSGNDANVRGCQ